MDNRLKQRVTGAVVLTALAIIVFPMLLDGSAQDREKVIAGIPEPPQIELRSMSLPEIEQQIQAMEAESAAKLPVMAEDTTDYSESDPEALTLDQNDLPVSWSLQLASFRNPDNALKLRGLLRDEDLRSYILQARTEEGEVYRVMVGPMLQRSKLAELGEDIEARFDLKGRIVRYNLDEDKDQLGG